MNLILSDFINKIKDVIIPYIIPAIAVGMIFGLLYFLLFKGEKGILWAFLFGSYGTLIICETVVRRLSLVKETEDFWGFAQLLQNPWYIVASVENIIMFIPFGFFLGGILGNVIKKRHRCVAVAFLITIIFVGIIEVLQYLLTIGEAQVLDVVTALIGMFFGIVMKTVIYNRFKAYEP